MSARILIAEDEVIIRMDLVEMLVAEGYDVIEQVGRGDEAVARARELFRWILAHDAGFADAAERASSLG